MDPVIPPHSPNVHPIPSDGRRHAGPIEQILHRHWSPGTLPNQQLVTAVDRLAGLPSHLAGRLVAGLTAIHVGTGTVTDYAAFADLHDQPVNPARPDGAKWQHIPAAYRDGVIVVGSGGSPLTRDLTMHEVGHALDDLDAMISGSPDFRALHYGCCQVLADDRYIAQREEFFAEAFAIVYLREWDVLEALLSGHSSRAYSVKVWFGRNYGIGR